MRIVRPHEGRARLAVAAGFHLGARPAALAPSQRDLFSALAQRAFASVVEQAARAGCQAFVCGGGLFADPLPSLEQVRAAMAPLGSARRAGLTIVATGEQHGRATDGTSFLAEVGLIDAVLSSNGTGSVLVSAANLQIALVTGGVTGDIGDADLVLALDTPDTDASGPAPIDGLADMVIDTRAVSGRSDHREDVPLIETGWAGPSLDRAVQPGFVVLDIDPDAGVMPTFMETEALRPARLIIDSPQSGDDVARRIAAEQATAGIVDVEIRGRTSRAVWHEVDPSGLIERAAAAGTLLRFAIDGLIVDDAVAQVGVTERPSFLVNTRRASEKLLAATGDESEREIVAAARARVVEIARRSEPTKAVA